MYSLNTNKCAHATGNYTLPPAVRSVHLIGIAYYITYLYFSAPLSIGVKDSDWLFSLPSLSLFFIKISYLLPRFFSTRSLFVFLNMYVLMCVLQVRALFLAKYSILVFIITVHDTPSCVPTDSCHVLCVIYNFCVSIIRVSHTYCTRVCLLSLV